MSLQQHNCKCGKPLSNEHGFKTRFVRINSNNSVEIKCKSCGEFNAVPLAYLPPKAES